MTEEEFDALRPSAFAIADRMLGCVSEAEDVVQDGFLRLQRAIVRGPAAPSPATRRGVELSSCPCRRA
jgi:DNA-directed RNA polymerase specialized sigma24 family protein